jgi:hypothetical protein
MGFAILSSIAGGLALELWHQFKIFEITLGNVGLAISNSHYGIFNEIS